MSLRKPLQRGFPPTFISNKSLERFSSVRVRTPREVFAQITVTFFCGFREELSLRSGWRVLRRTQRISRSLDLGTNEPITRSVIKAHSLAGRPTGWLASSNKELVPPPQYSPTRAAIATMLHNARIVKCLRTERFASYTLLKENTIPLTIKTRHLGDLWMDG